MIMKPVVKNEIIDALKKVGLTRGDAVMVHTSLSQIGYVCGGAQTVIEALIDVVGQEGTIMMPTQSWKNLDPDTGVHWDVDEQYWNIIRENWPAYDKKITPTNTMGATAEMFRQWPGALRSDHPARSVAAWGKNAKYLTENHDLCDIFGEESPVGKLYKLDGKVLLIGVDYDKNTSIHLADVRAEYKSKHNTIEHSAVMENGKRIWKTYETLFVDGEDFVDIGVAFENENKVEKASLGNAHIRCMNQRKLVDFAVKWIEENRC
jgi:aminoglycoside 3-N-acetyltransferase